MSDMSNQPGHRNWPILTALVLVSLPLVIMYAYQVIDSFASPAPGSLIPGPIDVSNWRFLWEPLDSTRPSVWIVTLNTFIFASMTSLTVCAVSLTAGYALSRLSIPARGFYLGGLIILHSFPSITLIIAHFLILQYIGLYDTLAGVILVRVAFELPLGVWLMKGFYDSVPWEIEMAGVQDGASRFHVWWALVLPQIKPGIAALALLVFLQAWGEFVLPAVLAPGARAPMLATFMNSVIADESFTDFGLYKAIGIFYAAPVIVVYLIFQKQLMNIYGGGTTG